MKKAFSLAICCYLLSSFTLKAQTVTDAKQLLYHEKYASAETALHTIIAKDAGNAEAWYLLSTAYFKQNKWQLLKDTLQKAPATIADNPLMHIVQGHIMLQEGNSSDAKQQFDLALKQTKEKDADVLSAVAAAYIDVRDADGHYAVELLQKAIKRDKKDAALYVLLGDAYNKLSDGSNAYSAYGKALELNSSYARASYRLGKIFTSQKNTLYLKYFGDALSADSLFAPALYEMYYHYYFTNADTAKHYLEKYIAASDYTMDNDYRMTDILFLDKKYDSAVSKGRTLLSVAGDSAAPRIFKLIANSYARMGKNDSAVAYMRGYFQKNTDTAYLASDFETMGTMYDSLGLHEDSAAHYYALAADKTDKETTRLSLYKKIAGIYDKLKNYDAQAYWLQRYYAANPKATNQDLFNWGIAYYYAGRYPMADSVFALYTTKYPDQEFGYYWRARSNVAIDTAMALGLAIPHYLKVIELAEKDTTNEQNRKRLVEGYGYIASYKANHDKDYAGSMEYFEKVVALQPTNEDAKKYVVILKKMIDKQTN